jgi:hypothetical protein
MSIGTPKLPAVLSLVLIIAACAQDDGSVLAPDSPDSPAIVAAASVSPVTSVALDIKPTSCPNPLNPKSQGVLPVAILGTEYFDVSDIDVSTILLEAVFPRRARIEDVATAPVHGPQLPDLEVVSFTGPSSAILGGVVGNAITLQIANSGNADVTTSFPVGFYVSSDPVITTADRLLIGGREGVMSIAAGTQQFVPLFNGAWVATDSPTGDVYLGVIVDEFDSILESDETNNTAHSPIRIDASIAFTSGITIDVTHTTTHAPQGECGCIDEGPDGFDDLILHFRTQEIVAALGSPTTGDTVDLTITGQLLDGSQFEGTDCVVIVGRDRTRSTSMPGLGER